MADRRLGGTAAGDRLGQWPPAAARPADRCPGFSQRRADPSHIDALLAACDGKLHWILATHTHPDHSPASNALAEATGAQIMGNTLSHNDGFQDDSFAPEKSFDHDEVFTTGWAVD